MNEIEFGEPLDQAIDELTEEAIKYIPVAGQVAGMYIMCKGAEIVLNEINKTLDNIKDDRMWIEKKWDWIMGEGIKDELILTSWLLAERGD